MRNSLLLYFIIFIWTNGIFSMNIDPKVRGEDCASVFGDRKAHSSNQTFLSQHTDDQHCLDNTIQYITSLAYI